MSLLGILLVSARGGGGAQAAEEPPPALSGCISLSLTNAHREDLQALVAYITPEFYRLASS